MADELSMAGLAPRSQQTYLNMVDRLAARSWKSVEEISEEEIRQYILILRDNGAAQGTFKTNWFGLQFLYEHVLGRQWALFSKKRSVNPGKSAFHVSVPTSRCNAS
ncbi:MAG: phage integrase N-terminal SAM-like domain-containing protein [Magnetococcales bacterium]|nr:phage integrase N-terminal SAM-like domain-containing protein [Magnetococcales bacterium]